MARIVAALGGNALGNSPEEQRRRIAEAAVPLAGLVAQGHRLAVTHGNGPQVGMIRLAFDSASRTADGVSPMPLPECAAMSQGYIGWHLQSALQRELRRQGLSLPAVSVMTQVEVSPRDPAFKTPTKPIGAFMTEAEARRVMANEPGARCAEDAGRGWRRMAASPEPLDIVEKDAIGTLMEGGCLVVACGGGGVPVVKSGEGRYDGAEAVIDKDRASALLAELIDADTLFILTAVPRVCINYGKPDQTELRTMTVAEAKHYAAEGQFAPGSMLPKVEAAVRFVRSGKDRRAVIAALDDAPAAMRGEAGTVIL